MKDFFIILIFVGIIGIELYSIQKSFNFEEILLSNKESGLINQNNFIKVNQLTVEEIQKRNKWEIEIPKINLIASISEGTSGDVLDNFVGHLEETGTTKGNIGLAAHNRGYQNNYFARIKELKKGDLVYYTYYGYFKSFVINDLLIIKDDNWDLLSDSSTTMLTLITCLEDRPHYRRCIQAVEI